MSPERIRAIRKSFGLTQVKFSEFIGISYDTYKNWEIAHRNPCGPAIALLYIAETQPTAFIKNRREIIKNYKSMVHIISNHVE